MLSFKATFSLRSVRREAQVPHIPKATASKMIKGALLNLASVVTFCAVPLLCIYGEEEWR
jgi:hypothetical protein